MGGTFSEVGHGNCVVRLSRKAAKYWGPTNKTLHIWCLLLCFPSCLSTSYMSCDPGVRFSELKSCDDCGLWWGGLSPLSLRTILGFSPFLSVLPSPAQQTHFIQCLKSFSLSRMNRRISSFSFPFCTLLLYTCRVRKRWDQVVQTAQT
jgi:hypothetical protein